MTVAVASRGRVLRLALAPFAFFGLALAACGPSFQVVYEGDARFEHCYAIDDTPTVPMQEKTDCWTQWMASYTYGQTRNRVDYAAMRAKALKDAPAIPTDEVLMSAAPGGGTGRAVGHDEPVTTNAFAPPPKTMHEAETQEGNPPEPAAPEAADRAPAASAQAPHVAPVEPLSLPREGCTGRCKGQWGSCRAICKGKCTECDKSYAGCMKACF